MNESLGSRAREPEPTQLGLPQAAWARLRSHLGPPGVNQQVWDASFSYGVSPMELSELVDHWRDELELPRRLLELPCFEADCAGQRLRFVHARARRRAPLPLLLLHGYSGSLFELGSLAPALTDAGIDVVCPALPGFGSSSAFAPAFAEACAALMQQLGYSRYAVHGSDLGAALSLRLAASDPAHVAALHVSHVPAYPEETPSDLASLTSTEKAQLARLTELHQELEFQLPETPVEELAFALARLDEPDLTCARLREDLLTSLTLSLALGDSAARAALYRATFLTPPPPSDVPIALHGFPLGAPTMRRFAERTHRVAEWREQTTGGPAPGIEQPGQLVASLAEWCERVY